MYHKDYTIRLIQQFVVFMAKLVGLKTDRDPEVILIKLEGAYRQFSGFDARMIRSITAESLLQLFSAAGEPDHNRLLFTSILLKEDAAAHLAIGNQGDAKRMVAKARALLRKCDASHLGPDLKIHYGDLDRELKQWDA